MNCYFVREVTHYCNVSLNRCEAIPQRKLQFYDLTFVLQGKLTYTFDGHTQVLKKNDAILLPPGTIQSREKEPGGVKFVSFNFYVNQCATIPLEKFIPNCISADIKKIVSAFTQSHLTPYGYAKEKVANLLNYILLDLIYRTTQISKNEHVQKIIRYIDAHITENLSLQSVSREIGLSKEHVATIFKKEMGQTLCNYLNKRKMMLAKELLYDNIMPLTDLSAYLGYNNYNYFCRVFKRYFDMPPSAFKSKK